MTRQLATLFGLVVLVSVSGCQADNPEPVMDSYEIIVDSDEFGGFYAELPDGRVFTNSDEYAAAMPAVVVEAGELGQSVAFVFGPYLRDSLAESAFVSESSVAPPGAAVEELAFYGPWGYVLSFDPWPVRTHVGGCIGRVAKKISIRLNQYSTMRFDAHFAGWREGYVPCFGIYESRTLWCASSCSQSARDMIGNALIAAGVVAAAAWAIAQAAAPYAVAALAI